MTVTTTMHSTAPNPMRGSDLSDRRPMLEALYAALMAANAHSDYAWQGGLYGQIERLLWETLYAMGGEEWADEVLQSILGSGEVAGPLSYWSATPEN